MGLGIGHGLNDDAPEQKAVIRTAKVCRVIGNTDTTEGRGRSYTLGRFLGHAEARRFAEGRGVMAGPAEIREDIEQVVQFVDGAGQPIRGEVYILGEQLWTAEKAQRSLRESARAKLTAEEWAALGLPRNG